ncbi:hypothetical protein [Streptomyces sp. NPDC049906]|uniref:hypothetical protein n=1 Tax=Streptomyces sp. NPDC049906 TaxID=3155656 RepID=UPI003431D7CB
MDLGRRHRGRFRVAGRLALVVLLPGERARLHALRREDGRPVRFGDPLELRHPER